MILLKRVYEETASTDGKRVLVDRLWPRGLASEAADFDWEKTVAPSDALRMWYGHTPERFAEFTRRYREELTAPDRAEAVERLARLAESGTLTLLTATKDPEHSQAEVLKEVLRERTSRSSTA
ncbi:MAG TPA: DUF488 family protein [Actinocatenispora sp.]